MASQGPRKKARVDQGEKELSKQTFTQKQRAKTESLETTLSALEAQFAQLKLSMQEQIAENQRLADEQALIREFLTVAVAQMSTTGNTEQVLALGDDDALIQDFVDTETPFYDETAQPDKKLKS